jgi:hypothetical protein
MAAMVHTSSAAHSGPLSLAAVAALLGQQQLAEDTLLWAEHNGKLGPKLELQNIVDVGDAGDVGDDEDGLEELSELLEATLLAADPELYTAEELDAIEAVRRALRVDGVAEEMIADVMLIVTTLNCVSSSS